MSRLRGDLRRRESRMFEVGRINSGAVAEGDSNFKEIVVVVASAVVAAVQGEAASFCRRRVLDNIDLSRRERL